MLDHDSEIVDQCFEKTWKDFDLPGIATAVVKDGEGERLLSPGLVRRPVSSTHSMCNLRTPGHPVHLAAPE